MKRPNGDGMIWKLAILALLLCGSMGCWPVKPDPPIVLPESKVQKMLKGKSASFDGYLLTTGGLAKLMEAAERCKATK